MTVPAADRECQITDTVADLTPTSISELLDFAEVIA